MAASSWGLENIPCPDCQRHERVWWRNRKICHPLRLFKILSSYLSGRLALSRVTQCNGVWTEQPSLRIKRNEETESVEKPMGCRWGDHHSILRGKVHYKYRGGHGLLP